MEDEEQKPLQPRCGFWSPKLAVQVVAEDEIGLELMRLYRRLRAEVNPRIKAALRDQIDDMLDRAVNALPAGYVLLEGKDHHD